MRQVRIIISGKVHGVWYRDSAQRKALELGLTGFAKNKPDGTVEAAVQGEEKQILSFIEWCKEGPPLSRVTDVSVQWEKIPFVMKGFCVR